MIYKEETRDLFSVPDDYYLAHCISADFGMGKGIAVEFNNRFDMKHKLQTKYPDYINEWHHKRQVADCILEGRVFNLVTKERYWHKPTYETLKQALEKMKEQMNSLGITKLAIPRLGCGLDKLSYTHVVSIIKEVFFDTEVEIVVCMLKQIKT